MLTPLPLISIITVSFNSADTIERTIRSIINQTYPNIEYIIIDGGSTDGTVDIIKKYASKISYWCSEPDKGIYDAMNKGALKATGEYIQYINSSDTIYNNTTTEEIVKELNNIDVIYGDLVVEKEIGKFHLTPATLSEFTHRFPIFHPSTWVKREVLLNYMFDTQFKIAADFNLLRELYFNQKTFKYIPRIFTIFEGQNGISSTGSYTQWYENQFITNGTPPWYKRYFYILKFKIGKLKNQVLNYLFPNYYKKYLLKKYKNEDRVKEIIMN